jgi:3-oxoacid CoA-transferase B subunit
MSDARERIGRRIIQEFKDGDVVNLGAGIPALISKLLPPGLDVMIHSENGILGEIALKEGETANPLCVNASNIPCSVLEKGVFFDSSESFGIVRGGRLDYTVLGAMQVDQEGNLANYMVPGSRIIGMGGAMDLVVGARNVFIAIDHCTKKGEPKILKKCAYPLTGRRVVDKIFTELCVIDVRDDGLVLSDLMEGATLEDVLQKTEADLIIPDHIAEAAQKER